MVSWPERKCVCVITFSADIMVRGAGFGQVRVELRGGREGTGSRIVVEGVFFLSSSACASVTGDCSSVSLFCKNRETHQLKEKNSIGLELKTKYQPPTMHWLL